MNRLFRTRIWLPAIKEPDVDFDVRDHDLRHAHASWLLAGGSDLKSSWTTLNDTASNTVSCPLLRSLIVRDKPSTSIRTPRLLPAVRSSC